MNNKDLFDAIHNINENYITSAWNDTESERPIMLRAEKTPLRKIILGAAGMTAAAAAAVALIVGIGYFKGVTVAPPLTSGTGDTSLIDENSIVRFGDVGFYRDAYSSDMLKLLELHYTTDTSPWTAEMNSIPPGPDVYYYNDKPYHTRNLSPETISWLEWYIKLPEIKQISLNYYPDEITQEVYEKDTIVRYGNAGFYRAKYTEDELAAIDRYYKMDPEQWIFMSCLPASPDVYYFGAEFFDYGNRPYDVSRLSEDTVSWLHWYTFFSYTAFNPTGYVPSEIMSDALCPGAVIRETYDFNGVTFKSSELKPDTVRWLNWYETLPEDMQWNVTLHYTPRELKMSAPSGGRHPGSGEDFDPEKPLPFKITGPDNVQLTYGDAANASIIDESGRIISVDNIENASTITFNGFVYLADPASRELKRCNKGDEICGLTVSSAYVTFIRDSSGANYTRSEMEYKQGYVSFNGDITAEVYAENRGDAYDCTAYGLPVIGFTQSEPDHGAAGEVLYDGTLLSDIALPEKIMTTMVLTNLQMIYTVDAEKPYQYQFTAAVRSV